MSGGRFLGSLTEVQVSTSEKKTCSKWETINWMQEEPEHTGEGGLCG